MTKVQKNNLISWLIYTVGTYVVLLPFKMWITAISISLICGFLFGMLNTIIIQLRKLNGEKFSHLEEKDNNKPTTLIKS